MLRTMSHENAAKTFNLAYEVASLHAGESNTISIRGVGEGGHRHLFDLSNERNLTGLEIR